MRNVAEGKWMTVVLPAHKAVLLVNDVGIGTSHVPQSPNQLHPPRVGGHLQKRKQSLPSHKHEDAGGGTTKYT